MPDPREVALRIRLRAVRMVAPQGFGYLGQALSSASRWPLSSPAPARAWTGPSARRGTTSSAPFAAAAELGLLDDAAVAGYGQNGSPVEAIGTERSPVFDDTGGSLGQGLSRGAGVRPL